MVDSMLPGKLTSSSALEGSSNNASLKGSIDNFDGGGFGASSLKLASTLKMKSAGHKATASPYMPGAIGTTLKDNFQKQMRKRSRKDTNV